ncbi:MAG: hypothetical protein COC23_00175 [Hyphomicrobiales bacterium]|nr:MAG: hypothetical protein COC23_00175 [Hyphomicrobiales bacterium]
MSGELRTDAAGSASGDVEEFVADYVESVLDELRTISVRNRYDFLAYLIEMAMIEAGEISSARNRDNKDTPRDFRAEHLAKAHMGNQFS